MRTLKKPAQSHRRYQNLARSRHRFFFSSRRRHTRYWRDWSSDVCSSDLFNVNVHLKSPALVMLQAVPLVTAPVESVAITARLEASAPEIGAFRVPTTSTLDRKSVV